VSKLAPGGNGQFLQVVGGVSVWDSAPTGGISQLTGDVTAGPGSGSQAARAIKINGVRIYTLEEFGGSVGASSTTNDAAMVAALAAIASAGFGDLWLGAGTYALKSGYLIPTRCRILGLGRTVTKLTTTDNACMFTQNGDYVSLAEFEAAGNSTGGSQDFFRAFNGGTGFFGTFITNVLIRQFAGYAAWFALSTGTTDGGTRIVSVNIYNCGVGIRGQSEYSTFIDCTAYACGEGYQSVSGNQTWIGGELTVNSVGFHLVNSGGNDAHGLLVGTKCNHNTTNVLADATANGYVLSGCDFYDGALTHTSAHLIKYIGCHVDPDDYYFDGSWVQFSACTFPQGHTNTIHNDYNSHTSTTRWEDDCVDLTGAFPAFIKSGYDSKSSGTSPTIQYSFGGYISATGQVQSGIGGSNHKAVMGPDVGAETSASCLWLLPQGTAPSSTNFAVQSDGNYTIVSCPTNSFLYGYEGGSNQLYAFSLATNTIGYSDSRAVNTILGSMTTTHRSTSSNLAVDSGGVSDKQICMTGTCTITLPPPTAGRELEILVFYDPTASGGTIARNGAGDKINGASADLTLTGADKFSILLVRSNGTDWIIKGGLAV